MSRNANEKGSPPLPPSPPQPPPPQQIDEPKIEILQLTEQKSATEELTENSDPTNQQSSRFGYTTSEASFKILYQAPYSFDSTLTPTLDPQNSGIRERMKKLKRDRRRRKDREIYREALHNTRDTITLVAILIATFAYTTGVDPPGGVYQDGPLIGTAVAAQKTAFKVFTVCNNLALFTSIGIVVCTVRIIPLKRRAMMFMLRKAQKAILVAILFLTGAYVAAQMVIVRPLPGRRGMDWTTVFLFFVSAGSLGTMLLGLLIFSGIHVWRKKQRTLQKEREKQMEKRTSSDYETG